jgi:hypothetical protein
VSAILQQLKLKSRTQAALLASTMYKQRSADPLGSGTESSKKARITKTQHNPGRSVREKASIANAKSGARNQGSKRNTLWRPSAAVGRRG